MPPAKAAISRDRNVERAAALGGVIIDQKLTTIPKRDGINAGVWIGQSS